MNQLYLMAGRMAHFRRVAMLGGLLLLLLPWAARAQCNFSAVVRNQTVTLAPDGTATVLASGFDNGSSSACGPLTFTLQDRGSVSGSVGEGGTLTLTAPSGALFAAVLFASYGTPGGSAGSYTLGGCHATNSVSVVSPYLLGNNSGSIGANNGTFGDPCGGTVKTLAVTARYNQPGGPFAAQFGYTCVEVGSFTVNVKVTDASGNTSTQPVTLTLLAPPAPTLTSLSPNPAIVGQTITATGTNLSGSSSLTVNGAAASISSLTATGFTFVVPAGAANSGNVVVSAPCGQTVSRAFALQSSISSFSPTSGPVSTLVTVAGTNLAGATAVTLNGTAAGILSNSGTSLTFRVPAGASTGLIAITTASGTATTSALSPASFTVLPVPYATSFAPTAAVAGTSVTLTGGNLAGLTALVVNGVNATASITGNTGTSLTFVVPAGANASQNITLTGPAGTTSTAAFTVQLRATAVSPTANARAALRTASVSVTLSEPVVTSPANGLKVYSAQAGGRKAGAYSASGNTLTLDPTLDFKPGETVFATVLRTVQGAGGLTAQSQVFQFTTAVGGTGTGNFRLSINVPVNSLPVDVAMADVDGDGDLDMLSANHDASLVSVHLNNGTGTFNISQQVYLNGSPQNIVVGDVDGDGDLDFLASSSNGYLTALCLNDGSGNFQYTQDIYAYDAYGNSMPPFGVTLGDVDGDGDLDLLVANQYNNTVNISLNGGDASGSNTGSFYSGSNVAVAAGPVSVAVGDVDGDGDLDLLAANQYNNTVSVRLNNGTGTFSGSQEVAVGANPYTVTTNDVDGDGDLDLLTANYNANTVSVRLNDGTGTFGGSQEVAVGANPQRVLLADVDADTDLDLLAANSNGTVSVRLNDGTGTFAGGSDPAGFYSTGALALGDVDGDGDLDLLAPTNYSTMGVYLNQPPPAMLTSLTPSSGEVGASVTITGVRLTGTTAITFNGVNAPGFVVNSPTSITVTVPAGATTGNVLVTTPNGSSNGLPFTVLVPVIASLNPTSGLVGTSVEITGSYLSATTLVRFNGVSAPGFVVNSPTSITVAVPAGATTGNVVVTTPSGVSNGVLFTVLAPVITSLNPNSGFVGSSTDIIGNNLATITQVRFNGVDAPGFVVNSNTSITVTVPVGATTGNVLVTSPSGVSNGVLFTVPVPVLSTFTPAFAVAGTTVAVTGTTLTGLTALTVNGVNVAASITGNTDTGFSFVVPAGGSNSQSVSATNFAGTGTSAAFILRLLATPNGPLRNARAAASANSAVALTFSEAVTLATMPATPSATIGLKVYSAQVGGRKAGTVTGGGTAAVSFASSATGIKANFMPGEVVSVTVPPTVLSAGGLAARKQVYQFTAAVGATGTGKFQPGTDPSVVANPVVVALGDVDGDGDLDVLTGSSSSSTAVSVRLNGGNATTVNAGTFSNGSSAAVGFATGLALGDINGDGNLDYVLSTTGTNIITRFNNAGTGIFTTGQTLSFGLNCRSVALGDVDGDGDLDIVAATAGGLSVSLNGSNSTGTNTGTFPSSFSSSLVISGGGRGIALADVDGDGDLDALIGNATNNTVNVRLNGGNALGSNTGVFSSGSDVSVAGIGYSVAVGDVDGDGDLDLLAANSNATGLVSVRLNDGTGAFSGTQNVAVGSTPRSVAVGDVDGDGDLDFVTANFGAAGASVRFNDGFGTFSGSTSVVVNASPSSIALGDVDGDGDLDFVTANTTSTGTVSVRLNVPQPAISSLSAAAELPGMPVTITGVGFAAGSTVTFGGVSASVTFNSITSLTAVVPATATVGSSAIVVTTSGTTSATSPAFTVLKVYDAVTTTCPVTTAYATTGDGQWHYLLATTGEVVAALQDTRAALGSVSVSYQVTGMANPVREDGRHRKYLDRNFVLVASGGRFDGSSLNVRFYGLTTELDRLQAADATVTYTALKATQYSGANEDCDLGNDDFIGGEFRALNAPASTPGGGIPWFVAEVTVADHFSEFFLTSSLTPLPVALTAFTATADGPAAVALAWTTASEKNSALFEVERSTNGKTFALIGTVAAAGNSSARAYALTDARLPAGVATLYYRLRQVDVDGTFAYSPVRSVLRSGKATTLTLYPNPTHAGATLTGIAPGTVVAVFDALGRQVTSATADAAGTAALVLPTGLATGVYVVRAGITVLRLTVE